MNYRSPRDRFRDDAEKVKKHQALVDDPHVADTIERVMAHYVETLPPTASPAHAWNNACKIEGAREIMKLFVRFADKPEPKRDATHQPLEQV